MKIKNSSSIYIALEKAEEIGIKRVLTGDGADGVFGGYSFLLPRNSEYEKFNFDVYCKTWSKKKGRD
ncbi:hypothetical protein AKJ45_01655 [candidate division MSBL1 archaeon SCGC-AAA261F19]|uniref:Asparagine synthetase domain-containing protein n=1 Tax=candidate division MSBL1 archaeon SCGC-AAA261F19 TaxID=1698275 RepID=A0A133VAD2_9EURY|nr:hypothetical protein AKJ45_01655 [candidate division MSBL1 archaeon SCGC-AAA261F19]